MNAIINRIKWEGQLLALIVHHGFDEDGANFFTSDDNPLQLGILKHEKGNEITPHVHKQSKKVVDSVQEVLHIEYGKIAVDFYDGKGKRIMTRIINSGDTILLIAGGHGFRILNDSKIIEVKQGPYFGVKEDKEYLEVNNDSCM